MLVWIYHRSGLQLPGRAIRPQEPKVIKVQKLKDNFYVLTGGGGNTSVFITQNNGVVVVETKLPGWGPLLVEKIKRITNKLITTIINTHCHADHTSGNPFWTLIACWGAASVYRAITLQDPRAVIAWRAPYSLKGRDH